jgi:hypothetical protein
MKNEGRNGRIAKRHEMRLVTLRPFWNKRARNRDPSEIAAFYLLTNRHTALPVFLTSHHLANLFEEFFGAKS